MLDVMYDEVRVNGKIVARLEWAETTSASEKAIVETLCLEADEDSEDGYDDEYNQGVQDAVEVALNIVQNSNKKTTKKAMAEQILIDAEVLFR